jgi:hypothetical protein
MSNESPFNLVFARCCGEAPELCECGDKAATLEDRIAQIEYARDEIAFDKADWENDEARDDRITGF